MIDLENFKVWQSSFFIGSHIGWRDKSYGLETVREGHRQCLILSTKLTSKSFTNLNNGENSLGLGQEMLF